MCGIMGYIGDKEASSILIRGINNLEYRGYDSVGILTLSNSHISTLKDVGKVDEVRKNASILINDLIEYSQRCELLPLEKGRMRIKYDEKKKPAVSNLLTVYSLFAEKPIKDIEKNIVKIADGFLHATKPEYAKYVGYISSEKSKKRLSQAALETLSIIAYKQPITKPELESIRGVNCDYMLTALLEKKLITIAGREETIPLGNMLW